MAPQPGPLLAGLLSPLVGAHRLAKLAGKLEQEEQTWEVACGALQRSQEEASQRMDHEVARMQVPRQGAGIRARGAGSRARGAIWKRPESFQPSPCPSCGGFFPCSSFLFSCVCVIRPGVIRPALSNALMALYLEIS